MSQTALNDFARIAQQLAEALDKHKPTQGNQTLLVLADLANELPEDNPLRHSIEQQMAKIAATDFSLENQDLNKTLIVLGSLKGRLTPSDDYQDNIDVMMAKVLAAKFDLVNGQADSSSSKSDSDSDRGNDSSSENNKSSNSDNNNDSDTDSVFSLSSISNPAPTAADNTPEPKADVNPITIAEAPEPVESVEPAKQEAPVEAPAAEEKAEADTAPEVDQFADSIHTLQIALDQLPVATRQAFDELKAIEEAGGTVQSLVDSLRKSAANPGQANEKIKAELEKVSILVKKIEDAPAEADQLQVLYDQVDSKHKDLKTGVFSIFQSEYGGNAHRFVVERTNQYAKYVQGDEPRQRMIEDLHKLIDQAQKNLKADGKSATTNGAAPKPNNRAFFHG